MMDVHAFMKQGTCGKGMGAGVVRALPVGERAHRLRCIVDDDDLKHIETEDDGEREPQTPVEGFW
jgi:hypothetical protein